ncbi:MAG: acetate--CoA ligase family protein [Candidatus Aenigmarchaeota archaeon]|nr:acetate--CoA ligase family protein [Candidatus Aenigmarchaeota archaeon]
MRVLTEYEAMQFLGRHVPVARIVVCKNSAEVVRCVKRFRFPVVLKLAGVLHKTDVGGVKVARNYLELRNGYTKLMKTARSKKIRQKGIVVQEFVKGTEVIIGIKRDAAFGHAVMVGIGGIHVELLRDVSFRVCPITGKDAASMVDELRMKQLLFGFRGSRPANVKLLTSVLVKVSRLPLRRRDIEELDINPFMLNDKTGKVVDARIVLR